MSNRDEVVEFWNGEIGRWTQGDHRLHPDLTRWLASYSGRGAEAVDLTVFPEPYIEPLATTRSPALVMLGLNPGAAAPVFQGTTGIYADRIRQSSYGQWAASGPYTDEVWNQAMGETRTTKTGLDSPDDCTKTIRLKRRTSSTWSCIRSTPQK